MPNDNGEHLWNLIARKLSGDITFAEQAELEQLLQANPGENYSIEILQDLWTSHKEPDRQYAENKYRELVLKMQNNGIDDGRFEAGDHYYYAEPTPEINNGFSRKKKFLLLGSLAILLIVSCAAFFYRQKNAAGNPELLAKNEISTRNGSKTSLVLPDGSKVWLNSGSKLVYDKTYGNSQREVTLVGEAYFDVVKKPDMPFVIHTSKMDIKVLGTAFNVKCYPSEKRTETSLIRGSVEITLKDRPEKFVLKPNEKLVINDAITIPFKNSSLQQSPNTKSIPGKEEPIIALNHLTYEPVTQAVVETAWVENRLMFNSETFEEVARKMERWYGVIIRFTGERLKQKKFTGIFENETVGQALAAMKLTTSFNYSINKDLIILSP